MHPPSQSYYINTLRRVQVLRHDEDEQLSLRRPDLEGIVQQGHLPRMAPFQVYHLGSG